ncbi:hypothetical protein FE782_05090 [Paenibacillus antri]|uniref:Beta-galactosidase trimerisation domain-containing protein n=1 Tax=Paenibacillus antri TaxID=2582848 RepID=A0A5R9GES3_9BACL|nr:hypothetical protein [Paenibacillus antri]TLS53649.1 hypothetical protein FE782_05090 [Paenibacillus antri]
MQSIGEGRMLRRATLEMSLKPFRSLEPAAIEAVCEEALRQWKPLLDMAESASMLLWISDGSEILTWNGDESTAFEWAKYIGFANEEYFSHIQDKSSLKIARPYADDPVRMTYGDLKRIVAAFKRIAADRFGVRLEVGATFDAGPEFAYSDFKYKLHPEINRAELGGRYIGLKADYTVVCTWSKLKADGASYAAYPQGIPEGTPFGRFFGRQCASFLPALGFDYIWFSNGFALSYFPWTYLGANYDGTSLPLADYEELSSKVLSFWDEFKRECPGYRIEIRGTNFGTGMDLAKDHIPMLDLYEKGYLEYPAPNSPWGALNFDFGLEMTGYMSRIAELPGDAYPFRYYPNDPWFWQNPWNDLYDREPHDIYCPLAAARINREGGVESPGIIEILTIDTERGELDETTPAEVIPHLRRALRDRPDAPGLLTWLYPFRELHEAAAGASDASGAALFHDWFVRGAVNAGLPLNTVVGTDVFFAMDEEARRGLDGTILFVATSWLTEDKAARIADHVRRGGKALLYGAARGEPLLELLNLRLEQPIEGDFELDVRYEEDELEEASTRARRLRHQSMIGDGGLAETVRDPGDPHTRVGAEARQDGRTRAFAVSRALPEWNGGRIGWVRGSLPFEPSGVTHLPVRQSFEWMDASILARYALQDFGFTLLQRKYEERSTPAMLFLKRRDNAWFLVGCKKDSSVRFRLAFPDGEPLVIGQTTVAGRGGAEYALDRTFHDECRVFAAQDRPSQAWCRELSPVPTRAKHSVRHFAVGGLDDATLTVYPPIEALDAGRVELNRDFPEGEAVPFERKGNRIVATGVSGTVSVTW